MKLYDIFQEDCLLAIRKIKEAKTTEDRIKASLNLAKIKVDYYEEHANADGGMAKTRQFYEDQYKNALWSYQAVLDEAFEAGVCLAGLTYGA